MTKITPKDALELSFWCNDLDCELTIKEYFLEQILTLWEQGEGFSGKRPFGNSGWEYDLQYPLVKAGAVIGAIDETDSDYPQAEVQNYSEYYKFITKMIEAI